MSKLLLLNKATVRDVTGTLTTTEGPVDLGPPVRIDLDGFILNLYFRVTDPFKVKGEWLTLTVDTGGRVFTTNIGPAPQVNRRDSVTIVQMIVLDVIPIRDPIHV